MESASFAADVDKSQIPPLNQKRILAFVNHFLISTCTFLNEFALGCEFKFIELERKLQKTEAALIILEKKLASIPTDNESETGASEATSLAATEIDAIVKEAETEEIAASEPLPEPEPEIRGVRVCEDVRYIKYFKMLHVGVPAPAVKQKMRAEGLAPDLLDKPESILADGVLA